MQGSLSIKIFSYFAVVIIMSLSIIGGFTYLYASKAIERQTADNIAQTIRNTAYQTDLYLKNYDRATYTILSSNDVKKFLDMDPDDSYSYFFYMKQIQGNVLQPTFLMYPQIAHIYLIGRNGRMVSDDNQTLVVPYVNAKEQFDKLWGKTPMNGTAAILTQSIRPSRPQGAVTIARRVRGLASYQPNGVLAMEFNSRELSRIWGELDLGEDSFVYVLDQENQVVYTSERKGAAEALPNEAVKRTFLEKSFRLKIKGTERLFVTEASEFSGWRVVASVPLNELQKPIITIRRATIMVGIATLVITLMVAYRFGTSIVKPVRTLMHGMRETEKGNWQRIDDNRRKGEIGILIGRYNTMVSRLSDMIERVYQSELDKQKAMLELQQEALERNRAEFQALQLQMNPHFLYNTLETIKCYAVVQDSEEITEMVESLALMLRYAIQTNLEEITVANELKQVLAYMAILKHRLNREVEIEVVIPPPLFLEKMVRLTMQPLVENIVQHGFPNGMKDGSYIRIDARRDKDRFYVIVEDNGAGMPEERLNELRQKLKLNRLAGSDPGSDPVYHSGGIGLMNVHRRIQLVYGEQYGLTIESTAGVGTTMIMTMPADTKQKRL